MITDSYNGPLSTQWTKVIDMPQSKLPLGVHLETMVTS